MAVETTFFELFVECGSPTAALGRALINYWAAQAKHNQHTAELPSSVGFESKYRLAQTFNDHLSCLFQFERAKSFTLER